MPTGYTNTGAWASPPRSGPVDLAVELRRWHVQAEGSDLCMICHERQPCLPWRDARAQVLTVVRAAFTAGRRL